MWLVICMGCSMSFIKDKNRMSLTMKLAVGGLFVFLMIFENRARYIYMFIPIVIVISRSIAEKIKWK